MGQQYVRIIHRLLTMYKANYYIITEALLHNLYIVSIIFE